MNIHEKVLKEFELSEREYYYSCFEGEHVCDIVEFVENLVRKHTAKKIFDEIEKIIEKYFIEKPDDYDGIADIDEFLKRFIKLKKKFLGGEK